MKGFKNFLSEKKLNILFTAVSLLSILAVWLVAYYSVRNDYVIPSVQDTFKSFGECLISGAFWTAFAFTLLRTALASVLSFLLAVISAVFSVLSKTFAAIFKPLIAVLRALPTLAVALILLIWTSPNTAPVIVTVLVLFPISYSQIMAAIGGIDEGLVEMAEVYNIPRKKRLFKMYLPLILPNILAQTGTNISLGLKVMVSAEVLANTYKSLGGLMQTARLYVEIPRLAALTLTAVLAGLLIELAFSCLERTTFKWNKDEARK